MKVKIKKYPNYFGPYQFIEKVFWWTKDKDNNLPKWVDNISDKYLNSFLGTIHENLAFRFVKWQENRRVKIKLDPWDTWNMDNTLAYIALPMLKQLKLSKQGAPFVDFDDRPTHLIPDNIDIKFSDTDEFHFEAWNWVLNEMIFAFESVFNEWEDQFHTGVFDRITVPVDIHGNEVPENDAKLFEWRKTDKDTSQFDKEGYTLYSNRIDNGFRLFGKYYRSLWS